MKTIAIAKKDIIGKCGQIVIKKGEEVELQTYVDDYGSYKPSNKCEVIKKNGSFVIDSKKNYIIKEQRKEN